MNKTVKRVTSRDLERELQIDKVSGCIEFVTPKARRSENAIDAVALDRVCKNYNNICRIHDLTDQLEEVASGHKDAIYSEPITLKVYEYSEENYPKQIITKKRLIMIISGYLTAVKNQQGIEAFIQQYNIEYIDSENWYCKVSNGDYDPDEYIEFKDAFQWTKCKRLVD